MSGERLSEMARLLDEAWETRRPVPPLSETHGLTSIEDAYEVQRLFHERRVQRGERLLGRKIGLTARAVQRQLGVDQPDFGHLWASRYFPREGSLVEVPRELFLQPRIEGELAFLIGRRLAGPGVTPQEVLAATEAVAPAFEIVDSRIEDWRITITDTIADNASYGGFTLGAWRRDWLYRDLRTLGMVLERNGEPVAHGAGAAALDHPAAAVAWLADTFGRFGVALEPGDIVLSGSWIPVQPVEAGDVCVLRLADAEPLVLRFA